jgi:hypothetical protein
MNFSLIRTKSYNSFFQLGCGLAYLSNPYDRIENPKNNTIGSHFNLTARLMYDQKIKINKHWEIISGIGITHFSNGAFTLPNYGVNNLTFSLGISYIPQQIIPQKTEENNNKLHSHKWDLYSFIGVKENYPVAGPKYFSFDFCFDRVHLKSEKFDWYYGIDIMYDQAKRNSLETDSVAINSDIENTQIAAKFGGAWKMGNFSLHTQIGFYLYTKDMSNGRIYDRLMMRYRFGNHWMFNLALKTHYAKADVFEAGIGYRL